MVAAIEYNYERDGEIIIPAGAKAFGDLQQANRNGNIGIHFHTLQMPDGTTEKIDATSMSLTYGPLKGSVSGGNAVKRILVRSMTGVGTMAAYLVGGPGGFGGVSGQLDNSILLRERIASNAGLAGEQEMSEPRFQREHRGFSARQHQVLPCSAAGSGREAALQNTPESAAEHNAGRGDWEHAATIR